MGSIKKFDQFVNENNAKPGPWVAVDKDTGKIEKEFSGYKKARKWLDDNFDDYEIKHHDQFIVKHLNPDYVPGEFKN